MKVKMSVGWFAALVFGFSVGVSSAAAPGPLVVFSAGHAPCPASHCFSVIATSGLDGNDVRDLTEKHHDTHPKWSPDGAKIVFLRLDRPGGLEVMNVDGSHLRALRSAPTTYWPGDDNSQFTWLDNRHVGLVTLVRVGSKHHYELTSVDVVTGKASMAARLPWGPDFWAVHGHRIVLFRTYPGKYTGEPEAKMGFWIVNFNATGLRHLANGLQVYLPSGGNPPGPSTRTIEEADGVGGRFAWSPDGQRVLFDGAPGSQAETDAYKDSMVLWTIDIATGAFHELPNYPWYHPPRGTQFAGDAYPSYSPDGSTVVVTFSDMDPAFLFIPAGGVGPVRYVPLALGDCTGSDQEVKGQLCRAGSPQWRP